MKKFSFLLVLVLMVFAMSAALAEAVPSKDADDMTSVDQIVAADGVEVPEDFEVVIAEPSEEVGAEMDQISDWLAMEDAKVMDYFAEDVAAQVGQKLPEGVAAADLMAYEVIPMETNNYDETIGDVTVVLTVATPYADGQPIVALLGLPAADGTMQWTALDAAVVNGKVEVTVPANLLAAMENEQAMIVLLSTPVAE